MSKRGFACIGQLVKQKGKPRKMARDGVLFVV